MAATGNTDPVVVISGHHSIKHVWRVTATGVTSFTIATPCVNKTAVVTATSEGTALSAQPTIVLSTGVVTVGGVTQNDIVNVCVEDFG